MKKGKDKKSVQSNVSGKVTTMAAMVAALGLSLGVDVEKAYAGDETTEIHRDKTQAEHIKWENKAQSEQIKLENKVNSQQFKVESQQHKIQSQQIKVEKTQGRSNIR